MRWKSGLAVVALVTTAGVAAATERKAETADYKFSYAYPDLANAYPGLRAYLTADRAKVQARIAYDAKDGRRDAKRSGYPFNPYDAVVTWRLVTDTPRFVSLSADRYTFTGGAHGNPASDALLWDKAARRMVAPKAVFASLPAVEAALRPAFCRQLDAQRIKRRGGPAAPGDLFGDCPPLKDLVMLLGSSGGGRINRIGLIADPYVAGPYAEGAYEVTLPVTPALLRAVRPAYRDAFSSSARA